nr:reverse transcriptase domain-containing protein [Tanacetum cinerariifolium]
MMKRVDDFIKFEEVYRSIELSRGEFPEKGQGTPSQGNRSPRAVYGEEKQRIDNYNNFNNHRDHYQPYEHLRKNLDRYCNYNGEKGHYTNDCYQLKKLETTLEFGKHSHLVKDVRQRGNAKGIQHGNSNGKGKVINMVWNQGNDRKRKSRVSGEEGWMNVLITFPPILTDDVSDEPLLVKTEVEGFLVRRVFVDQGAVAQVMFEHCFDNLPSSIKACLTQTQTELVGFLGEQLIPMGKTSVRK